MDEDVTCTYSHEYTDVQSEITHEYRCPRRRYGNGPHCIFHSPTIADHDEIREFFISELKSGLDDNDGKPLLFIGCRIPSVDVPCLKRSVYFTAASFLGDIELHNVHCRAIDFTDAKLAGHLEIVSTTADILSLRRMRFATLQGDHTDADRSSKAAVDLRRCNIKYCDMALVSSPLINFLDCDFTDAQLRGLNVADLYIQGCRFNNSADFSLSKLEHSEFRLVTFGGSTIFADTSFKQIARFTHVQFRQQELTRFCRKLSNVSFLNTNMTKIRFDADTVWNDDNSHIILDERELVDNPSTSSLSDVLAVYRSLRECHEYWLMYDEAGQFYVREMDMRRWYKDTLKDGVARRRVHRYISLANGYNVMCRYGESFKRASVWVASVFGVSTIYYFICPDQMILDEQNDLLPRLAAAPERTLAAFLHVRGGSFDDHIVRVASLPVLGSMFIVLKRRLERRFRH